MTFIPAVDRPADRWQNAATRRVHAGIDLMFSLEVIPMKRIVVTMFLTALLLSPLPAMALPYVGASIGNSWYGQDADAEDIANGISDISENSTGWKIFGGFSGGSFLGVEGGYRDLGKVESVISNVTYDSKTNGWDVAALGHLKIAVVDVFAKVGAFFWNTEGTGVDENGTDLLWGLGAGVHLGAIGVRLEWESMEVGNPDNLSMLSLGATFGF
jgi:OOP family OmpA-OmpF porin